MTDKTAIPVDAVVRDFDMLKGRSVAAVGYGLVVGGLVALLPSQTGITIALAPMVGIAVASLAEHRARRWYAEHVGTARAPGGRLVLPGVITAASVPLLLLLVGIDAFSGLAVLATPPAVAALLYLALRRGLQHSGFTPVHVGACLALALVGIAPALVPLDMAWRIVISFLATGVALIVIGRTDHRRLVAALGLHDAGGRR